jgi:hypothetical protein
VLEVKARQYLNIAGTARLQALAALMVRKELNSSVWNTGR